MRWTGARLERYAGTKPADVTFDPWASPELPPPPGPRAPREPRPYVPEHDPGWQPVEGEPPALPAGAERVTCAAESGAALWIGTTHGLARFDEAKERYETFGPERGLSVGHVTALDVEGGWLLVSTMDGLFLVPAG